jgi:hypothetical protein
MRRVRFGRHPILALLLALGVALLPMTAGAQAVPARTNVQYFLTLLMPTGS